jgi:hypothetical protein
MWGDGSAAESRIEDAFYAICRPCCGDELRLWELIVIERRRQVIGKDHAAEIGIDLSLRSRPFNSTAITCRIFDNSTIQLVLLLVMVMNAP